MKRRSFVGLGLGALALGCGGGLAAIQPRGSTWPRVGSGSKRAVDRPFHVVVVGGGLAGMSAAATLAARGVEVSLLERSDQLGGKLAGWPIRVGGVELPMEHGFHGFFHQYYTLRELLHEAGADRDFVPQPGYPILFRGRPTESFPLTRLPFPLNLVEVLAASPSLGLGDVAGERPGMDALLAYDPVESFARWDGMDMQRFIREGGLEGPFADVVLRPFGQASLNALDRLSAAEAIRFFHFYMLGSPEGLAFDALRRGPHLSILAPLRAHLERLGVAIRTQAPVRALRFAGGRVRAVELGEAPLVESFTTSIADLGDTWTAVGSCFVRRGPQGWEARDGRCTHMGCPVARVEGGFLCPCHAGRYDDEGRPVAGPPPRALGSLPVAVEGDRLRIGQDPTPPELLPCDAVVLATEVRAFRALAAASDFSRHAPGLAAAAEAAGEADPYAVVRFWFDRPVRPDRAAFYTVAGWRHTDSIAVYSAFQEPFTDGAEAVIESHAYAVPLEDQGSVDHYREALLAELREAFPELAEARVRHVEAMTQSNFTRFAPGDFAKRPEVATEVPNLFVAGDHVRLPFPAFLMEAAAASGRLAANHLLAGEGVEEAPIRTVALRGRLAGLV